MATLRVALAQINSTVGDFPGNIGKIGKAISRAKDAGAALVVFPEMAVCGYPPEDLLLRPRFLQDSRAAVEEVAKGCRGITAAVGFVDHVAHLNLSDYATARGADLAPADSLAWM